MSKEHVIFLKKGKSYFHAAFLDEDLTVPVIETYIFIGLEEGRLIFSEADDDSSQIEFEQQNICGLYDRKALSKWLLEDHTPTEPMDTEYVYKLAQP